jgi:pimeloyl-ACP methyl ester carboxylesterase
VPLLASRFDVVTYDQRAYGRSAGWDGPYSLAGDLFGVVDEIGFEQAALVGLSRGGRIALDAVLERPERVSRLALVASGLPGHEPSWDDVPDDLERRWDEAEAAGDHAALADIDLEFWAPLGADAELRAMFHENAQASNGADPAVEPEPPAAERLGELDLPVLVVTAGRDVPAMTEIGDVLERGIAAARRLVIAEADHMVPWRRPRQLADLLATFLAE